MPGDPARATRTKPSPARALRIGTHRAQIRLDLLGVSAPERMDAGRSPCGIRKRLNRNSETKTEG